MHQSGSDWEKSEADKKGTVQTNAVVGGGRVATVSGSRLSASFFLLTAVNHSMQASAAPLFICCSYVSSYGRCRKGKEASLKGRETDHLVRGGTLPALV